MKKKKSVGETAAAAGTTRREFISAAAGLGVAAAAGTALWAPEAKAAPTKGGNLRVGLAGGSTSDSLDPSPWADTFMVAVGFATRGNLTEVGADGTLKPEIAESWESSAGATVWRFKLRKGAQFSNGKSVSAEDVIASLNLHRGDKSKSGAKAVFETVTDIKADGRDVVVVTLSSGTVDFPDALSDHHICVVPAKDGEADFRSGVGAGPYLLETFEPGVRAILKRNPNSYKSAYLDSVEIISVADVVARQAALTSGRVDLINRPDLKTSNLLARRPGIRVEETAGRLHYSLPMNTKVGAFTNKDVRAALKLGIDREMLLKTIFSGHGSIGNDQPITPAYRFHNPKLAPRTYDPDKARFHLKQAGQENLSVDFHVADAAFNGAVDLAVLFQQRAAKAGININIVREPSDGYWTNVARKKPWYASYWSGRATEDLMFSVAYSEGSPWNDSRWSNAEFNKLLVAARLESNDAKRRELYYEMQRICSDDSGAIIPINANSVFALTGKVQHEQKLAGNWELDGARFAERWWMA